MLKWSLAVQIAVYLSITKKKTGQEDMWVCGSLMIPSARPTVPPVAITDLTWNLLSFVRFWKMGTDVRTHCVKIVINTYDYVPASWINKSFHLLFIFFIHSHWHVQKSHLPIQCWIWYYLDYLETRAWKEAPLPFVFSRGVDVNKRTVTTHYYS